MADTLQEKHDTETIEKVYPRAPDELPLPEELAHFSHDELEKLEKNLVRRLDWTLTPVVVLLFLLNIL